MSTELNVIVIPEEGTPPEKWLRVGPAQYTALRHENNELRTMLAIKHCGTDLYHDDGELQDNREQPWIDWRRDPVEVIQAKLAERALKRLRFQEQYAAERDRA
jgi:hypothetical protein